MTSSKSKSAVFDRDTCPDRDKHYEPGIPSGYGARYVWAHQLMKTHKQTQCPTCKLYVIWVPKKPTGKGNNAT
jgi:hypothetical protein